jgi:alkanesulfonate monooxygenase
VNAVWRQDAVDFEGKYYSVADARVSAPPDPLPQIYFGGSSAAALPVAAQYVDVYLTWGEPPQAAAAKIERVRKLAAERGRNVRFGIRLHTISRDTSAAAWAVADELLAELRPDQIAKATELHAKSESEGQRRMTALHGGRVDQLEIYPNLWAGVGLVRGGAGTALFGSHEEIANLIYEYHSLGFDEFVLSSYPHLEEAYWFAEGVLPLLKQKGGRLISVSRRKSAQICLFANRTEVWTIGSSAARSSGLCRGSSTGSSPTDPARGCSARYVRSSRH